MEIRSLLSTSLDDIAAAFNEAFSDYFIDVRLTPELMAFKVQAEDIDLSISPAVFQDGKIQAFMLHGSRVVEGKKIAYNAGTGVCPPARRQGHVAAMYAYILPILRTQAYDETILEVIDINAVAQKAYYKEGFQKTRTLDVWVGRPLPAELPQGYSFGNLPQDFDQDFLRTFWTYRPTWQHDFQTALNTWDRQQTLALYQADQMVAYAIFTPFSGRVLQWAVAPAHRNRGLGKALLSLVQASAEADLRFVNVEQLPQGPGDFLYARGLKCTMRQFELRLPLKP